MHMIAGICFSQSANQSLQIFFHLRNTDRQKIPGVDGNIFPRDILKKLR
jgi:hypothetical protein